MDRGILRVAVGAVLASCLFAMHSRDARGVNDATAYQLAMSGQATCTQNSGFNLVTLEAHGYDALQNDVCEVEGFLHSGGTVSTSCPATVRSHKAWINERDGTDFHIIRNYASSPSFVLWPTTGGQSTQNGPVNATIIGPGCNPATAYSIAYLRP